MSDNIFSTLHAGTAKHIGIKRVKCWYTPAHLAKECDILYYNSNWKNFDEIISPRYILLRIRNENNSRVPNIKIVTSVY